MVNNDFKKMQIIAFALLVIFFAFSAGCTGSENPAPAQSGQQQTGDVQSSSETASKTSVTAVHNSKLKEFLPTATNNWESSDASGFQMDTDEFSWSWASKTYTQKLGGEAVVDVIIQDTAGEYVGYMESWDTNIEVETPDLTMKKTTVQGYPGWIINDKTENEIAQIVNVKDRFFVYTAVSDGKED